MQVSAQPAYRQVDFRSESPDRSEEDDQHVILENSTDSLESDSEQDWLTLCEDPDAHIRPPTEEEPNPPTLYEVMLTVVDWYASHKQTYTATTDLYNIMKLVAPPGTTMGTFNQLRGVLDRHRLEVCQVYDACPKGCIVYHNYTGIMKAHQYGDLDECPSCASPRYVGMGSQRRASHTVYFFPIARYLKDMFARTDLCPYLDNRPTTQTPETSIKLSRGYRDKVLNDPSLRGDYRHQGLAMSSDGIPYFGASGKHSRGAWPLLVRLASLPDGLWDRYELAHLYGLEAQEHWVTDVETGAVHRKRRYSISVEYNTHSLGIIPYSLSIILTR
jgi:hypothetical protein